MSNREKAYMGIIVLLLLALSVKSIFLDEVKNLNETEEFLKQYAYRLTDENHDNLLTRNNIVTYRVVSIKKINDEGISIIEVYDGQNNGYKEIEISGQYKAKVRKYLFYIIPYGEDKVLSRE